MAANIPKKVVDRLISGVKKFQPILESAKSRDINEADTVTIVADMLSDIFGYDKYSEITSEFAIRGTYCDLAIKIDSKLIMLIEVKAIGLDLKESHVKQAIDYAANSGVEWVVLTNGIEWMIYKVIFSQPIEQELIHNWNFLNAFNHKVSDNLDSLFLLSKEGYHKSALEDYHLQRQTKNRFFISAMMVSENLLNVLKRELRRVSPDIKIETEEIKNVLLNEVIKREVLDSEKFKEAQKRIRKHENKLQKQRAAKEENNPTNTNEIDSQSSEILEEQATSQANNVEPMQPLESADALVA